MVFVCIHGNFHYQWHLNYYHRQHNNTQIIPMEKEVDSRELQRVYQEYLEYEKQHQIPPKIRDKLICLAKLILKQQIDSSDFQSLDSDQFKQLQTIQNQYKIKLFLSVANCLMGKQEVDFVNARQATIKKDSFWSSWTNCYITYTSEMLIINKNGAKQEMLFKQLKVLTKLKKSGVKFMFGIQYRGNRYKIGFQTQNIAKQYRQRIKTLISGVKKKNSKNMKDDSSSKELTIVQKETLPPSDLDSDSDQQFLEEFEVQGIENQTNFKLLQHTDNGRMMIHKQNPNRFKNFLLAQCSDAYSALDAFMKTQQWNPQINQSKIINKLQQNCYIVYQSYKSTGYLTRARDYVLFKMALKKRNRYLLLQKSVTHPDYPEYKLLVRGEIKRKVTAFLPHPTNKKLLLIITEVQINFRGYNSIEDTKNLMLKQFEAYEKFSKYLIQKSFITQYQRLFDFQTKRRFNKIIFESIKATQQKLKESTHEKPRISLQEEFKQLLPSDQYSTLTSRYIELIKLRVYHYYHLKHKYSQSINPTKVLKHTKNQDKDSILLGDWKFMQDGQIEFVNQKALAAQKDVIKYIFKQIGSNILKGKSIMNMSLPVDIFDNKSLLERICRSYGYAPIFIAKAAESEDVIYQMKMSAVFLTTMNLLQMKLQKPFNPILGQTFQGYIDGIPVYMEQISHHPPISSILMDAPTFKIYGNLQAKVDMGLNSITGYNAGLLHIVFKSNNAHLQCSLPGMQLSGLMSGSRRYKLANKFCIMERQKGLYCEVSFGKDKKDLYVSKQKMKPCDVIGAIFKVSQETIKKLYTQVRKDHHKFNGINKKDVVQKLSQISGSWNGTVLVDGQVVTKIYDPMPYDVCYVDFPLPSDCNYREDLLYRRMGNFSESQSSKELLQNIQRQDRKLRGKKH